MFASPTLPVVLVAIKGFNDKSSAFVMDFLVAPVTSEMSDDNDSDSLESESDSSRFSMEDVVSIFNK